MEKLEPIRADLKPLEIGRTVNGEKIPCYQIGSGQIKLLISGSIHGNEVGTVKLIHRLINWFPEEKYQNLTVYFIPCLNLDGRKEALKNPDFWGGGGIGRFNANKVDLNRNFDTPTFRPKAEWTHGKNYQEKTEVYAGPNGNSEPETQALTKFIKDQDIKVVFSFHNAGADIVGNPVSPAIEIAKSFSKAAGYRYISPEEWLEFGQKGSSYEWCTQNNVAILEIEGSSRWGSDWPRQKEAIKQSFDYLSKV